jgi:hypothetical protein
MAIVAVTILLMFCTAKASIDDNDKICFLHNLSCAFQALEGISDQIHQSREPKKYRSHWNRRFVCKLLQDLRAFWAG